MRWSDYYEGAYSRAVAANAPGSSLSVLNKLIYLSKQYEGGAIDRDTFAYQQRGLLADGIQVEQQQEAQASAERSARWLAFSQAAQANAQRSVAAATPAPVTAGVASPGIGIVGYLQDQSTNGTLRYCKYSNGVVNTINVVQLCPLNTQ